MLNVETYNLLMTVMGAYYVGTGKARTALEAESPLPPILQVRRGYAESPGWYMIQAAEFDPEPLTVANLRVRDTYASERMAQALLDLLASEMWLDRRGEKYHLTAAGRAIANGAQTRMEALIAPLDPMPSADMMKLEELLRRIIDASLQCAKPPGSWCLAYSRNRAPAADAPPLVQIFQYLSDFNAFRDDAHMAAFQPQEPLGYVWEAFAFVADGQADSGATLFAQLAYRGYATSEYADALADLAARGWLESANGGGRYRMTEQGTAIRADVEHLTDQYFYGPWSTLNRAEVDDVHTLLHALSDGLQALAG